MNVLKKTLFGSIVLSATLLGISTVNAATLSIGCGSGEQRNLCEQMVARWAEKTGNEVKTVSLPASSSEQLALMQQLLAAGASDIDIFQVDVVWPGILANHLLDLKEQAGDRTEEFFPAIVQNNTVEERLVAMPWFADAGILYYRTDLLEQYDEKVPETWDQLTQTAQKIQDAERAAGNDKMWGFVWQGRAYEGLTCDALEWVYSHNGGTIVDQDGKITINNPNAVTAIDKAAGWVGTISPGGVLNYAEEEARGVFQSGNAVFMRNWPYAWALGQSEGSPVKGKIGIVVLPKGGEDGQNAATLGGWQLGVNKYSKHPDLAADLVMHMTSPEEQKFFAIQGSFLPTIPSLYEDQEILEANPFFADMLEVLRSAVARPSSQTKDKYNQVSSEFWNAVHIVLSGQMSAEQSLKQLESKLMRLSRDGQAW